MESEHTLEGPSSLNENYQQAENVQIHRNEIVAEPVNNQEILQQNVEVAEETIITADGELQDLQLTKCREYDGLSLTCRLRFEAELLATAKAKEEVSVRTLQSHIQELQENKEQLDHENQALQAYKENLQKELAVEELNSSHIEKQMENTGKIVDMLKQNYEGLEQSYQAELADVKILEQESENILQNYQVKKGILQANIKGYDEQIQGLRVVLDTENQKFNIELNKKNDILEELAKAEEQVTKEVADMKKECAMLKDQLEENNANLTGLTSQNQNLHNLINNLDLQELEKQKLEKQHSYEETLTALEDELMNAKTGCNAAEELKATLLKSLENEVNIGNDLEASYDQLENEHCVLITAQEELHSIGKTIESSAANLHLFQADIEVVDSELTYLNSEITETVQKKNEILNNLHIIQHHNQESQAKLTDLQHQTEQLKQDCELNDLKLPELQQKETDIESEIKNVSARFLDTRRKCIDTEKSYNDQLEKVNIKLAEAQAKRDKIKLECDTKINGLRADLLAYKADTEKANRNNQENYKQKLEEAEERLDQLQLEHKQERDNVETQKATIEQKKATYHKLQLELELVKVNSQGFSQRREIVSQPVNPQGILKSPGKPAPSKTVSWKAPSNSSLDSEAGNLDYWNPQDELSNELLRMSPPQRDSGTPRKRQRFD